ncbi:hypothetical protein L1887_13248 [Cichorium endivia]|nr:hypothetical protein L1887_13248 [Cichorium endivia]
MRNYFILVLVVIYILDKVIDIVCAKNIYLIKQSNNIVNICTINVVFSSIIFKMQKEKGYKETSNVVGLVYWHVRCHPSCLQLLYYCVYHFDIDDMNEPKP